MKTHIFTRRSFLRLPLAGSAALFLGDSIFAQNTKESHDSFFSSASENRTRSEFQTHSDADWLREAQLGVFTHFLPWSPENFALLEKYDVEAVARQMHELNVKYFVFTIYQNSGYMNAPNSVYDAVTGYLPGEKCSKRDVPMELADALEKYGIRLMLYITAQTPNRDAAAQEKFGLEPAPKDLKITTDFAKKYAEVYRFWSDHYGTKISGWWVDGSYEWCDFNEKTAEIYSKALKHGNPHAIVAFNPGVRRPEWKTSDYTAGEINEPFSETVESARTPDGQQRQILTFLGNSWAHPNCRFTTQQWVEWIQTVVKNGGAVTLDAHPNMDPASGPVGTLNAEQSAQIQAIRAAVK